MDFTVPIHHPSDSTNIRQQLGGAYIAHLRKADDAIQTVPEHLLEVATITRQLAAKIAVPEAGELIGLLHDFGKVFTLKVIRKLRIA